MFHWRFFNHSVSHRIVNIKLVCYLVEVFIDPAGHADLVVCKLDAAWVIPDFEIRWDLIMFLEFFLTGGYPLVLELVLDGVPRDNLHTVRVLTEKVDQKVSPPRVSV